MFAVAGSLILISIVYYTLFEMLKKEKISINSAILMLILSTLCFLIIPNIMNRYGFFSATAVLFLLIMGGIVLADTADFWKKGSGIHKEALMNISFDQILKNTRKAVEGTLQRVKDSRSKTQEANIDVVELLSNEEELSYVDFDQKSDRFGDVFTKFAQEKMNAVDSKQQLQEESVNVLAVMEDIDQKADATKKKSKKNKKGKKSEKSEKERAIEELIDKAFELKKEGKSIEAVELYIRALEKRPEEQTALWIVIDICTIYKQLGQEQLSNEMIKSYLETAGEGLDQQIKEEIMNNFNI